MTSHDQRKRDNQRPIPTRNLPFKRHNIRRENDHHSDSRKADDEGQLEALPDTRNCEALDDKLSRSLRGGNANDIPSIQNDDLSTSFPVEPHVLYHNNRTSVSISINESIVVTNMSYENMCARMAVDKWMLSPPKKNKLISPNYISHNLNQNERKKKALTRKESISNSQTVHRRSSFGPGGIRGAYTQHFQHQGRPQYTPGEFQSCASRTYPV